MTTSHPRPKGLYRRFKLLFGLLNCAVLLALIVLLPRMQALQGQDAGQAVQDERIANLQKRGDTNLARIEALERTVWVWQGAVLGFGALISFLELLQVLGFVRRPREIAERLRPPRRDEWEV